MNKIRDKFNDTFAMWRIKLPADAVERRERGMCRSRRQMTVRYLFGENEKGPYLDYYARHRIMGESHARIYADGTTKPLPSRRTVFIISNDPKEAERLDREAEKVEKMLQEKGF